MEGRMDWLTRDAIEAAPGKLPGAPVIEASRGRPEDLITNSDLTEAEIASEFGRDQNAVHEVLRFYRHHTGLHARHP